MARAVVTGMGACASIGWGLDEFWSSLVDGKSGLRTIQGFDVGCCRVDTAAEIPRTFFEAHFSSRARRRYDRATLTSLAAASEALRNAALPDSFRGDQRVGLVLGTTLGGMEIGEAFHRGLLTGVPSLAPAQLFNFPYHAPGVNLARHFKIGGQVVTNSTACASGTIAIGVAADLIWTGRATRVLAGGVDVLSPFVYAGFNAMRALSPGPVRPFDRERKGLALGEGAAFLVLEEAESANRRGARPLAEILGFGMSGDAYHLTAPSREGLGLVRALSSALEQSRIVPEAVDFVSAHGTGTPQNDRMETLAIKKVLGSHAYRIPVNSIKGALGHTLGAAGALEVVMGVLAMRHGLIPPTLNYQIADPDCDLDYCPNVARKWSIHHFVSTAAGFGGCNAALVLRGWG